MKAHHDPSTLNPKAGKFTPQNYRKPWSVSGENSGETGVNDVPWMLPRRRLRKLIFGYRTSFPSASTEIEKSPDPGSKSRLMRISTRRSVGPSGNPLQPRAP
jgi:hypothetical protein